MIVFALLVVCLVAMWALVVDGHNRWAAFCFVIACGLAWLAGILLLFLIAAVVAGALSFPHWADLQQLNARLKRH